MIRITTHKSKKTKYDFRLVFFVIGIIGLTYENINAFPFIVNLLIALSGLILMVIHDVYRNNHHVDPSTIASSRYYFSIILVIYMIVSIQYLSSYSRYYVDLFFLILFLTFLYTLFFTTAKGIMNRKIYTLNDELTIYYNKKFEDLLMPTKIKIFTYNGDKSFPAPIYGNLLTKHIYIDNKAWNILDDNEKDAVILHEIGHLFNHKNNVYKSIIGTIINLVLVYTLSIMVYFSVELNEIFSNFTTVFIIFNAILLIILFISWINYKKLKKYYRIYFDIGELHADIYAMDNISNKYSVKSALIKLFNYLQAVFHGNIENYMKRLNNIDDYYEADKFK